MWSKLSQAAGFSTSAPEDDEQEREKIADVSENVEEQVEHQKIEIDQLKIFLRESEEQVKEKDKQLAELSSKFKRFQIQSKARIANLTSQLEGKNPKKEEGDFDDASSSDSSDCSSRGKIILLRKQLETSKQQLEKKEKETQDILKRYESRIKELELQLDEKKNESVVSVPEPPSSDDKGPAPGSDIQEMYAQMVYKDSKILDLNNRILELERNILDLQEHVREKDEVLQSRNLAVQLMSADMSRKGKSVVDELEETRSQMKLMQNNFADIEHEWKLKEDYLKAEIEATKKDLISQIESKNEVIANFESSLKSVESARYELVTKNAELQKKVVLLEEKSSKHQGKHNEKLEQELINLRETLKEEKARSADLQKALDDLSSQSESKVFKARVKERTKLKALERELNELKSLQLKEQKAEEVIKLQQQVALLEEEKGTLQLRLIDMDEQISTQENLKAKNSELMTALTESEKKVNFLEEQAKKLVEERELLTEQVAEHEKSISEMKMHSEEVEKKNLSLNQDFKELMVIRDDLKGHVHVIEENMKVLTLKNQELLEEVRTLKDEKVSMGVKIIELEEIHENIEKQKEELQLRIEEMEAMLKGSNEHKIVEEKLALEARCTELLQQVDSTNSSKNSLLLQVENLTSELEKNEKILAEASKLKEDYGKQIAELTLQIEEMRSAWDEKKDQCVSLSSAVMELQNSLNNILLLGGCENISEFQTLWEKKNKEFKEYVQTNEALEKQLKELKICSENKNQEISSLSDEVQHLQHKLKEQEHSFKEEKNAINELLKQESEIRCQLENFIQEKDEIISTLKSALKEKEESIVKMKEDVQNHLHFQAQVEEERNLIKGQVDVLTERLSTESEKTRSKISSLLEQISDLESEVSRLNNKLLESNKAEEDLKKELSAVEKQLEDSVQECNQIKTLYQTACEEKGSTVASLQKELSSLSQNFAEEKAKLGEMHNDTVKKYQMEAETAARNYSDRLQQLENIRCEIETENRNLNNELEFKEQLLQDYLASIERFHRESNHAKDELEMEKTIREGLEKQLDAAHLQIMQLKERMSKSELSAKEVKDAHKSLLKQNKELEKENKKLLTELASVNSSVKESLEASDELRNTCTDLSNKNDHLSSKIEALKVEVSEHAALKEKFDNLLSESNNQKAKFESLLCSNQSILEEHNSTKLQLDTLQVLLESKEQEFELVKSELAKTIDDRNECETDNQQLKLLFESTKALLEEQKSLNTSLTQQLEAIRESTQQSDTVTYELSLAKQKLEKSVEDMTCHIDVLQSRNREYEAEITLLKTSVKTCKDIVSELPGTNSNSSFEDAVREVVDKCKILDHFKSQCFSLIGEIPEMGDVNVPALSFQDTDSISQYITNARLKVDSLKSQVDSHIGTIEQRESEIKMLNSQIEQISCSYSEIEKEYQNLKHSFDNLCEQQKFGILSLNCLPSKVASIEETAFQRFQNVFDKLESMNHSLTKLSLSKEQIQRLYLSYHEHNRILKEKAMVHDQELENLRLGDDSQQESLAQTICVLQEDIAEREHQIKALQCEITSNSETINSLRSELDSLQNSNEQLIAKLNQNKENYCNSLVNLNSKFKQSSSYITALKGQLFELKDNHSNLYKEQINDLNTVSLTVGHILTNVAELHKSITKLNDEKTSLEESSSLHNKRAEELHCQNAQLHEELQKMKQALSVAENDESKLAQEQQLQITALNSNIESLKLEMEKHVSEKVDMEKELDALRSTEKLSAVLNDKYSVLKEIVQTASDALSNVVDEENVDSSFSLCSANSSFDDDLSALVNHFQAEFVRSLKVRKQLSNEVSILQNKIAVLEKEIVEANSNVSLQVEENKALGLQLTFVQSKLESLEQKCKKDISEKLIQTEPSGISVEQLSNDPSISRQAEESLQQAGVVEMVPSKADDSVDDEKQKLRDELSLSKSKCDKMLVKLKLFKNKIDKLTSEVQELTSVNKDLNSNITDLQQKLSNANNECEIFHKNLSTSKEEHKITVSKLESQIEMLQQELESSDKLLKADLHKLQALCKEKEIALLQQEENNRISHQDLKKCQEQFASLEATYCDLNLNYENTVSEKEKLAVKFQNLQEQANMLMSDNETYQSVVEKLNQSNAALRIELKELNENHTLNIDKMKKQYQSEIEGQLNSLKATLSQSESLKTELQYKYDDLSSNYSNLTEQLEQSQQTCNSYSKEIFRLKNELEHITSENPPVSTVDVSVQCAASAATKIETTSETSQTDMDFIPTDSDQLKMEVEHLSRELQLARNTIDQWCEAEKRWKSDFRNMESFYQKNIDELQDKLTSISETPAASAKDQLEMELQQALSSLHKKNVQCEGLNVELSKLMEERNSLKLKLSQLHQVQFQQQEVRKVDDGLQRSSDVPTDSVKIEMASDVSKDGHYQSEIAALHQRLLEAERTCQELRKANEALDSTLAVEREQRQMVEEELGYAQRQLLPMDKGAKDEYRLLLEDFEEPEMLVEKNFSITREVKSHAYKFRRWLRGRRLYLHRSCQRKKYSEILYIFYICAIHLWLLLCLVKHS